MLLCSIKDTLGTHNLSFPANDSCRSLSNGDRQRLKRTLRPMVIVVSSNAVYMQSCTTTLRKTLQTMRQHLGGQVADLLSLQTKVDY